MFIKNDRITSAHHNKQIIKKLSGPIRPASGEILIQQGYNEKFYLPRNIAENQYMQSRQKVGQFFNLPVNDIDASTPSQASHNNMVHSKNTMINQMQQTTEKQINIQQPESVSQRDLNKPKTAGTFGHNPRTDKKNKSEINFQNVQYYNHIKDFRDIVKNSEVNKMESNNQNTSYQRARTALHMKRKQLGISPDNEQLINGQQSEEGDDELEREDSIDSKEMAAKIRQRIENNDFEIYKVNEDVRHHMKKFLRPTSQMSGGHLLSSQMLNSMRPTTSHTTLNSPHLDFMPPGDKSQRTRQMNNYLDSITIQSNSQWQTSGLQTRSSQGTRKSKRDGNQKVGSMVEGQLEDFDSTTQKPKSSNLPSRAMMKAKMERDRKAIEIDTNMMMATTTNNETDSKQDTEQPLMLSPNTLIMKSDSEDETQVLQKVDQSRGILSLQKDKSMGHFKQVGSVKFDVRIKTQSQSGFKNKSLNNNTMPFPNAVVVNNSETHNFISENTPKYQQSKSSIKVVVEQEREDDKGLDVQRDELTQLEYDYILNQREEISKDLAPYIEKNMQHMMDRIQDQNQITLNQDDFQTQSQMVEDAVDIQLYQQPVELNDSYHGFFDKPEIRSATQQVKVEFKQVNQKFTKYQIEDDQIKEVNEEQRLIDYEFLSPEENSKRLTQQEISFITSQYQKPTEKRNYDSLDDIVKKLEFFSQYSQGTRVYLLRLAKLEKIDSQTIIFNQGDEGDLMYVILRGGCHVRIKRITNDGREENPVIVSIYDGVQFGELAFMNQAPVSQGLAAIKQAKTFKDFKRIAKEQEEINQEIKEKEQNREAINQGKSEDFDAMLSQVNQSSGKRAATIETCEESYMLTISREYFKSIILSLMKKELDSQLRLLITIPFLDFPNSMPIIPIANMVESKLYPLGQIIIQEGEQCNEFFIVSKGRCRVVKEEIIVRHQKVLGAKKLKQNPPLLFGKADFTLKNQQQRKDQIIENRNLQTEQEIHDEIEEEMQQKPGHYQILDQNQEYISYRYLYEMGNLVRGDYFMGRALFKIGIQLDPDLKHKLSCNPLEPPRLTVIADAHNTEVYTLNNTKLPLLSMDLRNKILQGLIVKGEYDNSYTPEVNEWIKNWDNFQVGLIRDVMERKTLKQK